MAFAIIILFVIITGLCIGSFLNVVILRTLSDESVIYPASKCPECQKPLKWWHNIPVLSYLLLKGKCHFCKTPISLQYPLVEILTAVSFVLIVLKFGINLDTLFAIIILCLLIVIAGTDIKEQVVYDKHTYSLIGIGLLYSVVTAFAEIYNDYTLLGSFTLSSQWLVHNPVTVSLLGTILGFVIMEIISRIGFLFAGDRAFGEGDSYIAAGIGAIFGWRMVIPVLILSVVIQALITLPIFIKKEFKKGNFITLISLAIFSAYTIIFYFANQFGWLQNIYAYVASVSVLVILGLLTCREILVQIKEPANRTYLPFGPALVTAGIILLLV